MMMASLIPHDGLMVMASLIPLDGLIVMASLILLPRHCLKVGLKKQTK